MLARVARIRIVDEWLRSPVSAPSRYRAIMVVADSWAEQRVLMRAFSRSPDQTRPTIVLHGSELAIGPAGVEAHDEWGIHVEPPADGRAQELKAQLELAARRLAGSKGTPPRLEDEAPRFEKKRTNNWAPGTPPDLPPQARTMFGASQAAAMAPVPPPAPGYYEPALVAPPAAPAPSRASMPTIIPRAKVAPTPTPPAGFPVQRRRRRGWTSPIPLAPAREVGSTTAMGYASGQTSRPVPAAAPKPGLSSVVDHTMPLGFRLSDEERNVLNALGEADSLTAHQIGEMVGVADSVAWMETLIVKLTERGLDLIMPGNDLRGEPTYRLRR